MRLRPLARPPVFSRAALPGTALLAACTGPAAPEVDPAPGGGTAGVRLEDVRAGVYALAADSMEGRFTGSPGMWRAAARLLADGPAPEWKPGGRPQPPARQ